MTKLNCALIGGGDGSRIGPAHRIGAAMHGLYTFAAGALAADPAEGRVFLSRLGVAPDHARGRIDLVTVATPNSTQLEIAEAFFEAGILAPCEKPMTITVAEAEERAIAAVESTKARGRWVDAPPPSLR